MQRVLAYVLRTYDDDNVMPISIANQQMHIEKRGEKTRKGFDERTNRYLVRYMLKRQAKQNVCMEKKIESKIRSGKI